MLSNYAVVLVGVFGEKLFCCPKKKKSKHSLFAGSWRASFIESPWRGFLCLSEFAGPSYTLISGNISKVPPLLLALNPQVFQHDTPHGPQFLLTLLSCMFYLPNLCDAVRPHANAYVSFYFCCTLTYSLLQ